LEYKKASKYEVNENTYYTYLIYDQNNSIYRYPEEFNSEITYYKVVVEKLVNEKTYQNYWIKEEEGYIKPGDIYDSEKEYYNYIPKEEIDWKIYSPNLDAKDTRYIGALDEKDNTLMPLNVFVENAPIYAVQAKTAKRICYT
jgi:hypothetical protein